MIELKLRTILHIALLLFLLLPCVACRQKRAIAPLPPELQRISGDYEIDIVTAGIGFPLRTTYGTVDGRNPSEQEVQNVIELFASEFTLYSPLMVRNSRLTTVVLCCDLTLDGQARGGFAEYEHDTIFLDITGLVDRIRFRKAVHHEFFHMVDFHDDGSLYTDERWARLNPNSVQYGNGGASAQGLPDTLVLVDKFPGFLNHYSTTGVEEDKAEVFANLAVDFDYVQQRAESDPVLRDKVRLMIEIMNRFSPGTEEFWEKSRRLRRE